jgi:hypothetical protein
MILQAWRVAHIHATPEPGWGLAPNFPVETCVRLGMTNGCPDDTQRILRIWIAVFRT